MDIICHSASLPGRVITPVDITLKGKKTQIVGETDLSNSWTATFYNDSEMKIRKYFTRWIESLHSLEYESGSGLFPSLGGIARAIKSNVRSLQRTVNSLKNNSLTNILNGQVEIPYYQKDIIVQQLNGNNEPIFEVTILGAFPINIEDIALDSTNSELSSTSVTFSFTDIKTKDESVLDQITNIAFGKI